MTKRKKITVGVVFGGRSGEHEVSIVSAQSVMKALDRKKYSVVPIGVTKEGQWVTKNPVAVLKSGKQTKDSSRLIPENLLRRCDVIFPVLHGSYGEDGTVQGMLEMANIPYVGSGVLGSAVAMDKVVQKQLCVEAGVPVVPYIWFYKTDWRRSKKKILKQIAVRLRYPIFVKPANLGSSVGISKCHNYAELLMGVAQALRYDSKVLVEQGIDNAIEIEVAVLGNHNPKASVPGEVVASNEFYDYDAKYVDNASKTIIPAELPVRVLEKIKNIAVDTFKLLNLSGMARIDFLISRKGYTIYLNEPNTIPGFTSISMYPKLWEASGLAYNALLDRLIELAFERYKERSAIATSYKPKKDWHV